ncbi:DUF1553 domain-containing protein [Pedobacter miscanthi]|uniref:DUF1553 domain-containing protein n=1 Tax=Pedobacter miscanthi TaxID=2259170 RepID=UPI002931728F|nr:DUF1553 domain-containing protein [Pedobacter miscanthi]
MLLKKKILFASGFALVAIILIAFSLFSSEKQIDFNSQVKPILNKKCISCHGGVKQQGGFSVLFREEALAKTKSGRPAIIPGNPEDSEFIKRLKSNDPEERMPYKHPALNNDEIDILSGWIKQGAKWGNHWAYVSVKPVEVPDVNNDWARNDLDKFILAKLDENKLEPSKTADKATLLRRVSLDLIGTYPSDKMAKFYLESKNEQQAYSVLIDSLLASPKFGERWASMWLDIARYADTKGYESDPNRNIWSYRDWVIKAYNRDMPYDQFITDQIAGDLFSKPTDAQYIATAFSRNTPTNDEGGTNNEEFRTAAVLDRVNATWEGLMSTTFSCVQCHSHPYDPFKHDEYYKFMSYFNNTRDEDVPGEYPLFKNFNDSLKNQLNLLTNWVKSVSGKERSAEVELFLKTGQPAINSTTADQLVNSVIGNNNIALYFKNSSSARLKSVNLENADQLILRYNCSKENGTMTLHAGSLNGPVIKSWKLAETKGYQNIEIDFPKQSGVKDVYLKYTNGTEKNPDAFMVYFDWFYFTKQFPGKGRPDYLTYKKTFTGLMDTQAPTTPIMVENPLSMQRKNYVFERGAWTSKGKEVNAGVPNSLAFAMPKNAPDNRMGLAMWLTDKRNPLVSRTMVNRLWEQLYGAGLVETLEDMGTQGMAPTHQELLDFMAYQFMYKYNWSIKKMLKELVMMATYRQDSKLSDELKEKDLFNKFYARGSRVRLSAEQIRDQSLAICGVLSNKMYGPPVMPWQPEGIWFSPYSGAKWITSGGEEQYRRGIYTYWKRTAPYPSAIAFDGASRVVCSPRRIRTNTPLQALVTLNDSVYIDLARKLALRMEKVGGNSSTSKIAKGYEMILYKTIPQNRLKVFEELYSKAFDQFKKNSANVSAFMGDKQKKYKPEDAAMVLVANAMLNLDEVVTKN